MVWGCQLCWLLEFPTVHWKKCLVVKKGILSWELPQCWSFKGANKFTKCLLRFRAYVQFVTLTHPWRTFCAHSQFAETVCSASTYSCGTKVKIASLGVNSDVKLGDCVAKINQTNHISSVLAWAQVILSTGGTLHFVISVRKPWQQILPTFEWDCLLFPYSC